MFMMGMDYPVDDEDEAIVACENRGGCEVYDTVAKKWIGPTCQEEIDHAKARIYVRTSAATRRSQQVVDYVEWILHCQRVNELCDTPSIAMTVFDSFRRTASAECGRSVVPAGGSLMSIDARRILG